MKKLFGTPFCTCPNAEKDYKHGNYVMTPQTTPQYANAQSEDTHGTTKKVSSLRNKAPTIPKYRRISPNKCLTIALRNQPGEKLQDLTTSQMKPSKPSTQPFTTYYFSSTGNATIRKTYPEIGNVAKQYSSTNKVTHYYSPITDLLPWPTLYINFALAHSLPSSPTMAENTK